MLLIVRSNTLLSERERFEALIVCLGGEAPATYLMQRGIPVGRPPQVELRNQHLSYAYTWYVYPPLCLLFC